MHTTKLEGQIYVPMINWVLAVGVIMLVLVFQNSNGLGERVRRRGDRHLHPQHDPVPGRRQGAVEHAEVAARILGTLFLLVEVSFFLSNLAKLFHGAWLPLAAGLAVSIVMMTWRRGQVIVTRNRQAKEGPLDDFLEHLDTADPADPPGAGTAVFLNPSSETTPLALRRRSSTRTRCTRRSLIVSVVAASVPTVDARTGSSSAHGPRAFKVTARHPQRLSGGEQRPDALELARKRDCWNATSTSSAPRTSSPGSRSRRRSSGHGRLAQEDVPEMARNAASPIEHFGLPVDRTVAMGSQINV